MKIEIVNKIKSMMESGWSIPDMIACIYDLFINYMIDEAEELLLYDLVDPEEEYNDVFDYWWNMNFENPLLNI